MWCHPERSEGPAGHAPSGCPFPAQQADSHLHFAAALQAQVQVSLAGLAQDDMSCGVTLSAAKGLLVTRQAAVPSPPNKQILTCTLQLRCKRRCKCRSLGSLRMTCHVVSP